MPSTSRSQMGTGQMAPLGALLHAAAGKPSNLAKDSYVECYAANPLRLLYVGPVDYFDWTQPALYRLMGVPQAAAPRPSQAPLGAYLTETKPRSSARAKLRACPGNFLRGLEMRSDSILWQDVLE